MVAGDSPFIAMVAGEPSGDLLGAGLIEALRERAPGARFAGVGGPQMIAAGLESYHAMARLAVNGFEEPIKRAPELYGILRDLRRRFLATPPDAFVGIDCNVFNFLLERRLKRRGVTTVHYVSPSVYAWRRGRARKFPRTMDLLLTLFPFESAFYEPYGVAATFVGHPLADEMPLVPNRVAARERLGYGEEDTVVALLPGSRASEVARMGSLFLDTACWVAERRPGIRWIVPAVSARLGIQLLDLVSAREEAPAVRLWEGESRPILTAADAALVKSGTGTLECLLGQTPMVVAYRVGAVTGLAARWLMKTPYVALPNILAGRELVPERLQRDATPPTLGEALLGQLAAGRRESLAKVFREIHATLRGDASARAAEAVLGLIRERGSLAAAA